MDQLQLELERVQGGARDEAAKLILVQLQEQLAEFRKQQSEYRRIGL